MAFLAPAPLLRGPPLVARAPARRPPSAVFGLSRSERRARHAAARRALWERIAAVRREQETAAAAEHFLEAAALRDRARALERKDAYIRLKRRLETAVKEQRFRAAARLRDALRETAPPPIVLDNAEFDFNGWRSYATARVNSRVVSNGVCVETESFYDVERSGMQERGKMAVFGVRVRVRNLREEIVQVVGRRWCIESFVVTGRKEVEGWGVGGERRQPVLQPGEEFVFETAVPVTLFGLVPVPVSGEVGTEGDVPEAGAVVVGACSGAVEFVSGVVGEEQWEADVGECFLVLPG